MSLKKLSVAIITYNEEKRLGECLNSVLGLADEIVVLDSYSEDRTEEIAKEYNASFYQKTFEGHIQQKNEAVALCSHDMILSLDADELLSPELKDYLLLEKEKGFEQAYIFHRRNWFYGHWMRWGVWYPDAKLRLFDRNQASWGGENPHDKIILKSGEIQPVKVKYDILHYTYDTYEDYISQMNKFSTIGAEQSFAKGKKAPFLGRVVLYPFFVFIKVYILRLGILDGKWGFVAAIGESFFRFQKYWKLHLLWKNDSDN